MAESSQSDEKLDLKVSDSHGALTHFKVKKTTKFRKILTAYASKAGIEERAIRLMVDGERVNLEQCPGDLDMENGDQIDAMVEQQGGLGAPPLAPFPAGGDSQACIKSGDPGPQQKLNKQDQTCYSRKLRQSRRHRVDRAQPSQVQRCPDQAAQQDQCGAKVDRQAEVADIGSCLETGGDHPPTEASLQRYQGCQCEEAPEIAIGYHPSDGEKCERDC